MNYKSLYVYMIWLQKAQRSYQKDISTFKEARNSNAQALISQEDGQGASKGSTISAGESFLLISV